MKSIFFFGAAVLASATAQAQNSAVINQQGTQHDVSVVQNGSGNTSVVSQSDTNGNRAVISQSGAGNTATINQGNTATINQNGTTINGQSVSVSQSGGGNTVIDQTDGSNSISIRQGSDPATTTPLKTKKRSKRKSKPSDNE